MFEDFIYSKLERLMVKAIASDDGEGVRVILQDPVMKARIADAADLAIEYEAEHVLDTLLDLGLEDIVDLDSLAAHAAYCGKGSMVLYLQETCCPTTTFYDLFEALESLVRCEGVKELAGVHTYVNLLDLDYGGRRLIPASLEGPTLKGYEWLISIYKQDYHAVEETYRYLLRSAFDDGHVDRLEAALEILLHQAPPNAVVVKDTLAMGSGYEDLILSNYLQEGVFSQSDLPDLLSQAIRFNKRGAYTAILWHMDRVPPITVVTAALSEGENGIWALEDLLLRGVGLDPTTFKVSPELLTCLRGSQFQGILYLLQGGFVAEDQYRELLELAVEQGLSPVVEELVAVKGVVPLGLTSRDLVVDQILRKHGATVWDLLEE